MVHPLRTIDLTLPLAVVALVVLAIDAPRLDDGAPVAVPVTGTASDPCSGEPLTFGGSADVTVVATPGGAGSYDVEVRADLAGAKTTNASGREEKLAGIVSGRGRAAPPFPATIEVDADGSLATGGSAEPRMVRVRIPVSVEDGSAAPTGAAEIRSLACRGY